MIIEGVDVLIANEDKIELYGKGNLLHTFKAADFHDINLYQLESIEHNLIKKEMEVYFTKAVRCESEGVGRIETNDIAITTGPRLWCGLRETLSKMDRDMSPSYERRGEM